MAFEIRSALFNCDTSTISKDVWRVKLIRRLEICTKDGEWKYQIFRQNDEWNSKNLQSKSKWSTTSCKNPIRGLLKVIISNWMELECLE
jgi:hypothetical protein